MRENFRIINRKLIDHLEDNDLFFLQIKWGLEKGKQLGVLFLN